MVQLSMPIRTLEELSFRALPALETRHYDGWLLRFANGYTRRCNSVNPVFCSSIELDKKIDYCEALYNERQMPTHFKLTDQVHPEDLDAVLATRGYQKAALTDVQVLSLSTLDLYPDEKVTIKNRLRDSWLTDFAYLNGLKQYQQQTLKSMLKIIHQKVAYATLTMRGNAVAVGLAVVDDNFMGIFDVVTSEKHRQKGYGERVVRSLLHWGSEQGAEHAWLQVVRDNEPAQRLYEKLGFETSYSYWYRSFKSA